MVSFTLPGRKCFALFLALLDNLAIPADIHAIVTE